LEVCPRLGECFRQVGWGIGCEGSNRKIDSVVGKHPFVWDIAAAVRCFLAQISDWPTNFKVPAAANPGPLEQETFKTKKGHKK
jgi:hypothetical protein